MVCLASHSMVSIEYYMKKRKKFSYIAKNENLIFSTLSDDPVLEVSTTGNQKANRFFFAEWNGVACSRRALAFFLEKGERKKMAFWTSLKELSSVSGEVIGAKGNVWSRKMSKGNICSGSLRQLSFLRVSLLTHDARVIHYSQGRPQFLITCIWFFSPLAVC